MRAEEPQATRRPRLDERAKRAAPEGPSVHFIQSSAAGFRCAAAKEGKRDADSRSNGYRPPPGGIALLAGLILLSALSLLAVIAANSMLVQQRMAGNFDDFESARGNAEQALGAGSMLLFGTPDDRRLDHCETDCFIAPTRALIHVPGELPSLPEFETPGWWQIGGLLPGVDPVTAATPDADHSPWAEPPRFTIEEVTFRGVDELTASADAPEIGGIGYYRILGRGTGRQASAVAVHEAIVARPWSVSVSGDIPPADWREFCIPYRPWHDCGPMTWRARR